MTPGNEFIDGPTHDPKTLSYLRSSHPHSWQTRPARSVPAAGRTRPTLFTSPSPRPGSGCRAGASPPSVIVVLPAGPAQRGNLGMSRNRARRSKRSNLDRCASARHATMESCADVRHLPEPEAPARDWPVACARGSDRSVALAHGPVGVEAGRGKSFRPPGTGLPDIYRHCTICTWRNVKVADNSRTARSCQPQPAVRSRRRGWRSCYCRGCV